MRKYVIGAAVVLFILWFSASLAVYMFSGLIMFAGLVAIVESVRWLQWLFARTGNVIDILIFGVSIYLLWNAGVTVAMGVSICGLLFTVFYKPFLIDREVKRKLSKA